MVLRVDASSSDALNESNESCGARCSSGCLPLCANGLDGRLQCERWPPRTWPKFATLHLMLFTLRCLSLDADTETDLAYQKELPPKLRKKLRNKIRMRERRKDPVYKEKERQRQAELRANRTKGRKHHSRDRHYTDTSNGSLQLNEIQSPQPFNFTSFSEICPNPLQTHSVVPQIAAPPNDTSQFAAQSIPVDLPCLEAERMHEATFLVALPAESTSSSVPAYVRMAVVPPIPSIITLVILPTEGASNEELKSNNATSNEQNKRPCEDQTPTTGTSDTRQLLTLEDLGDFCQNNTLTASRLAKRFKPSEHPSNGETGTDSSAKVNSNELTPEDQYPARE